MFIITLEPYTSHSLVANVLIFCVRGCKSLMGGLKCPTLCLETNWAAVISGHHPERSENYCWRLGSRATLTHLKRLSDKLRSKDQYTVILQTTGFFVLDFYAISRASFWTFVFSHNKITNKKYILLICNYIKLNEIDVWIICPAKNLPLLIL